MDISTKRVNVKNLGISIEIQHSSVNISDLLVCQVVNTQSHNLYRSVSQHWLLYMIFDHFVILKMCKYYYYLFITCFIIESTLSMTYVLHICTKAWLLLWCKAIGQPRSGSNQVFFIKKSYHSSTKLFTHISMCNFNFIYSFRLYISGAAQLVLYCLLAFILLIF